MQYSELGLSQIILDCIADQGYQKPTPIQEQTIPIILQGHDLLACAQTGTGKTAAFTLPTLQRLWQNNPIKATQLRALILAPTRELALQIDSRVQAYSINLGLNTLVVFGGVSAEPQIAQLRQGVDILIATPGRLIDLYRQGEVNFSNLEVLILDEADRMLDLGFIHDIKHILGLLPQKRQNLMFSATFSAEVRQLANKILNNPRSISVSPKQLNPQKIQQWICPVDKKQKPELFIAMLNHHRWPQVLVFTRTKQRANQLSKDLLNAGFSAAALHSDRSQEARIKTLTAFKNLEISILVATDIAARGLDIEQLPQVVNFDLPNIAEDYVHRIGRTGRAGYKGQALSLVSADEIDYLRAIEKLLGGQLKRKIIPEFEPLHNLPDSHPKKSAKNKVEKKPKSRKATKAASSKGPSKTAQRKAAKNKAPTQTKKPNASAVEKQSPSAKLEKPPAESANKTKTRAAFFR